MLLWFNWCHVFQAWILRGYSIYSNIRFLVVSVTHPSPKHTYSFSHQIMGGQEPSVSNKTYLALTWAVLLAAPTLIVSRTSRFSRWLLAAHRVFFPRSISRSTIHVDTCSIYWIVRLESLFQHVKPYFYRKFSLKDICEKRKRVIVSRTSKCAANMWGTNPCQWTRNARTSGLWHSWLGPVATQSIKLIE